MARKGLEQIIMQKQGDVAVVSLLNKRMLDAANIRDLADELHALVTERGVTRMVLNLDGVEYLSSAVLGKLISLLKVIKKEKGSLRICNVHPNVKEIFEVTQLDKVLGVEKNVSEAVNAIKQGKRPGGKKSRGWLSW
ncbi:MAG: STAS domain-containing protein [Planctomycetes bacterium]|nr:STAS domain-containing protein [Planctomycetota bacterium]